MHRPEIPPGWKVAFGPSVHERGAIEWRIFPEAGTKGENNFAHMPLGHTFECMQDGIERRIPADGILRAPNSRRKRDDQPAALKYRRCASGRSNTHRHLSGPPADG